MNGTIIKIIKESKSRNPKSKKFYTIVFKMEDGSTSRTYIDSSFINWANWADKIKVGTALEGLEYKNKNLIDADCSVRFTEEEKVKRICQGIY